MRFYSVILKLLEESKERVRNFENDFPFECDADMFSENIEDSSVIDIVDSCVSKNISTSGVAILSGRRNDTVICAMLDNTSPKDLIEELLTALNVKYSELSITETTVDRFFRFVDYAQSHGLLSDKYRIYESLGLIGIYNGSRSDYNDKINLAERGKDEILDDIKKYYLSKDFEDEIERISNSNNNSFIGIPAHYIISSESGTNRRTMINDLLTMLVSKNRLVSKRYTIVRFDGDGDLIGILDKIYKMNEGETVVIKINRDDITNGEFSSDYCSISAVCDIVKKYCAKTLTIFSVDSNFENIRSKIINKLTGLSLLSFTDSVYTNESAIDIIKDMAKKDNVEVPEHLIDKIKHSDRVYNIDMVSQLYSEWYHDYLSNIIYPEYQCYFTAEQEETIQQTDSYTELQNLIGLTEVKKVIGDIINYFKLQNEYRKRGIAFYRPCMHMVFTGNPGTAKTTVARLIAKILRENEILSVGNLVEAGRADIIAEYVGQTAPLVKRTFEKARGSVLFIDEAYSLIDDRKGLYGDEAINTIVQEMENNRESVVVIFAGYKKEMEEFLNRNPGLSSRIAFHVSFDDYSKDELLSIARYVANGTGYILSKDAEQKIANICEDARSEHSFGNGRFIRTLIEKAKLKQANRLLKESITFLSNEQLLTLKAEDFDYESKNTMDDSVFRIGFGA